jgi:prepilin peptidase CpaA
MCGNSQVAYYSIIALSGIAGCTDIARGKIYNWLTLPALAAGLLSGLYYSSFQGLGCAALGAAAGFLLFGWMYFFFKTMGAGDVKMLMALGAWGGAQYSLRVAILSICLGGLFALISLILKGRLISFSKKIYAFFASIVVKELEVAPPKLDRSMTIPFGVPMALAAVWVLTADPFQRWGLPL